VLDLIREGWDRLVRFFSGGEEVTAGEVLVCVSAHSTMLLKLGDSLIKATTIY